MRYILQEDIKHDPNGRRCINGNIGLRVPTKVIEEKCKKYMKNGKPIHLHQCTIDDAYSIVSQYQAEYRGIVQYYRMAYNLHILNKSIVRQLKRTTVLTGKLFLLSETVN